MWRITVGVLVACLLATGAASVQPASARTPPPGPPYPDAINGVRVYDHAGVLAADTIASVEATIAGIEERSGAELVVYTQVKPESDTPEEAKRDAAALIDQWGVGQAGIDDGLAILFDLEPNRCHGQVQLYAGPGYRARYLDNEARQAIFEQEMLPALRECDFDAALLAAMERIDVVHASVPPWFGGRVKMPGHGFAVTFPDDWVAFDTAVDYLTQLEAASDVLDPSLYSPDNDKAVREFPTYASRGIQLDAFHATSRDGCIAGTRPGGVPLDRAADAMYDGYVNEPGFGDVEAPRAIDLPAGATYRIDISAPHATGVAQSSLYLLGSDESHAMLICTSDARPDDRWLSIAETFEFLPAEE